MLRQAYGAQTPLFRGIKVVNFSTGLQQGIPLAPLCFSLSIEEDIRRISRDTNIWYLDYEVLDGAPET